MCSLHNVLSMRQTVQTGPSRRDRVRMNMNMRYMHRLRQRPAVVRVRRAVLAPGDGTLSASFEPLPCFVCATRRLKLFLSSSRFSSVPRSPPAAPQLAHEIMCKPRAVSTASSGSASKPEKKKLDEGPVKIANPYGMSSVRYRTRLGDLKINNQQRWP